MAFSIENFSIIAGGNTLKATADVKLDGGVHICGVKLIQKDNKLPFMAMPSKKEGNRYLDQVSITDQALRKAVETALCDKYQAYTGRGREGKT